MPECEICGKISKLLKASIEGSSVYVCNDCKKHAESVEEIPPQAIKQIREKVIIAEPMLNPDFAKIVRRARENEKLTRKQLAEKIKEKETVIERIERGNTPEEKIAKKLERELGIKILGYEEKEVKLESVKSDEITLGDVVEVKVRKK